MVILIIGFFAIEGTTDSTFTTHRGFFVLMLLGMILSDLKRLYTEKRMNKNMIDNENSSDK